MPLQLSEPFIVKIVGLLGMDTHNYIPLGIHLYRDLVIALRVTENHDTSTQGHKNSEELLHMAVNVSFIQTVQLSAQAVKIIVASIGLIAVF